jgi:Tfp pilus assembly protein PilO
MRENIIKLLTLGLIVILGYISYTVFISPKSKGVRSLQQTLKRIETQLNSIFGEDVTLRGGTAQNEEILRQLEKLRKQIPSERDLTMVVDEIISKSGKGLSLDYKLIEPQELKAEGKYKRLPIKLGFATDYYGFLTYLTQLSQLPVIVVIDSLKMNRSAEFPGKLDIDLELSAFLMPAQPGEAKKAEKETAPSLLTNPFLVEEEITGEIRAIRPPIPGLKSQKAPAGTGLKLQGIWKGKEIRAFINGKTVTAGDNMNGYQVDQIGDKKVVLTKGGKAYTLTLK